MPEPVAESSAATETICSGETPAITVSSPTNKTVTFSVTVALASGDANTTGFDAGSYTLNETDAIEDMPLVNNGADDETVVYTITPMFTDATAGTCSGDPITVEVTVEPNPSALFTDIEIGGAAASPGSIGDGTTESYTICNGATFATKVTSDASSNSTSSDLHYKLTVAAVDDVTAGAVTVSGLPAQEKLLNMNW